MASPITKTVTVPIALDGEILVKQLEALRLLASQIGFALDTAILALLETAQRAGPLCADEPHTIAGGETE